MSARLFKAGPAFSVDFVPFTIPSKAEPVVEEFWGDAESTSAADLSAPQINLEEVEQQAREMLELAQSEADQIIAQAQAKAAEIEREAREAGLTEARATITEEINLAVDDLRQQLAHTLSELEPLYALIATRAERDLVKLAVEIARKVVHREVTTDPDIVLTLTRVALERLHPRAVAKVRLHPDDFEYVNAHRHQLSNTSALEVMADGFVGRGGCLIQSEHGDIDARLEEQFASIERGFFQ